MEKNINILYEYSFSDEKNRGKTWYIIVLSFIIGIVIWGFLTKQYGLSFTVIIFSGVYLLLENNSDTTKVVVKFTNLGIFINDSFYEYEKINSFSIIYDGEKAIFLRLYLNSGIGRIDLDIDNSKVETIKNILKNYVEYKEGDKLTFYDKIIKSFKL